MADMFHEVQVQASPSAVLDALTTEAGLRAWWTADTSAEPVAGSVAEFGFHDRATVFRMKVVSLSPTRVAWECLGEPDEWRGTRLAWSIEGDGGASATVRFTHSGWASTDGVFAMCNTTWGVLMYRLRDHLEGRNPGPLFTGHA